MRNGRWQVRVTGLTDIYSETRVVDMLRTVEDVVVDRFSDQDGSVHVAVEAPSRSVAQLIGRMVHLIDSHASVTHSKRRLLAGA
jgi:hypothetical protein